MQFTRKIPGIRFPIPGRMDEATRGFDPFWPGWSSVLVFVSLLAVLGIHLFCTLKFGGRMAVFWLEPGVLGLSLYTIASAINGLLLLFVVATFLQGAWIRSRRDLKRLAGVLFTVALLGCTQVYLNSWKELAQNDHQDAQVWLGEQADSLRSLREELADLGQHPWAGEYVTRDKDWELRLLLTPDSGAVKLYISEDYSPEAPLYKRGETLLAAQREIRIEGNSVVLLRELPRARPQEYAVVERGERRYLVDSTELQSFLATSREPELDEHVYLRRGDEGKALGTPRVVVLADGAK